jgi:FemAB-related protein (PEP-CTERM system-associated)
MEDAYRMDSALTVSTGVDAASWDRFVESHPDATVEHLWGWRDVFERVFRHECAYFAARRDDRIVGVLPVVHLRSLLFGRLAVSLPYCNYGGVIADEAAVADALIAAAHAGSRRFGAPHLELRHRERRAPGAPVGHHKLRFTRRLPSSSDELWESLDRKVRNQVRKAQKSNLETVVGGTELLHEFYDVFAVNMRDLGTPVFPKAFFAEALARFPDRSRVFIVRLGRRCIAAGIAFRLGDTVLVPWASSLREFRPLCANMLLYWTVLTWAIAEGAATFDFGRSSRDGGTHRFKLQWGATEAALSTEYVGAAESAVVRPGMETPRMQYAIEVWKRMPLFMANALGPRVVRHVA